LAVTDFTVTGSKLGESKMAGPTESAQNPDKLAFNQQQIGL